MVYADLYCFTDMSCCVESKSGSDCADWLDNDCPKDIQTNKLGLSFQLYEINIRVGNDQGMVKF